MLRAIVLGAAALVVSRPGAATEEARVPFAFSDCTGAPLGETELLRALHLEQAQLLTPDHAGVHVVEVRYECDGHAEVRVATPGEGEASHDLYVHDVPPSERVRALALALTELTREVHVPLPPEPLPPSVPQADEAQVALTSPSPPRRPKNSNRSALVGFALRAPLGANTALLGALAAYQEPRWSIGGTFFTTRRDASTTRGQLLGSISALLTGAQVGFQVWAKELSPVHLELELAAGAGVVRLWGTAQGDVSARNVYHPYIEGRLDALVRLGPRGNLAPFLQLDLGRSSGVVAHAAGQEVLRTGGWFTSGALGLGF